MGLEKLQHRRWYRKLSYFHKFYKYEYTHYFFQINPYEKLWIYYWWYAKYFFLQNKTRTIFKNIFFPSNFFEWKNIDQKIRNSTISNGFRNSSIVKIINTLELSDHLLPNGVFNSHNPKGIRFIARPRLGLSHFQKHKFRHSFSDSLHNICNGWLDVESTPYYLFH